MPKQRGLWIAVGGGALADVVENSIESNGQFTTAVVASRVKPRQAELAVVSMQGTDADYIGISQSGRGIATGQMTIAISNLVALDRLSGDVLRRKLPERFTKRFVPPKVGAYRLSPRLWEEVLKAIRAERAGAFGKINELNHAVDDLKLGKVRVEGGLEVFERDAIAAALQIFGGTAFRKKVLRNALPQVQEKVAPFLARLENISIGEDLQIGHDHAVFPGMQIARRDIAGSVVLSDGQRLLTILNCNRQPLEHTLGVDLIYFNHNFDSFVLVQYKRMTTGGEGELEYRPAKDASYASEIERMVAVEQELEGVARSGDGKIDEFRLSSRPFYFKLCEPKSTLALDAGMVSGMYVPLALWQILLNSTAVRGPRGGIVITWDNCPRRFNNSEFTNLLRQGWIGSAAGESKLLNAIIESVLGNGRMLVLAGTSARPATRDFRRDGWGRFAAEDDPAGAI